MHRPFVFVVSLWLLVMVAGYGCGIQADSSNGSNFEADRLAPETMELADERDDSVTPLGENLILEEEGPERFVEGFEFTYNSINCINCDTRLRIEHYSRACALCSYKFYASQTLTPGQSWSSCHDARRTKVKVFGYYAKSDYNYQLSFWDCS